MLHPDVLLVAALSTSSATVKSLGRLTQSLTFPVMHCRETLRLYPAISSMKRLVNKPMPVAGHVAAPGDIICVATYSIHRDPEVWKDPNEFIPVGPEPFFPLLLSFSR